MKGTGATSGPGPKNGDRAVDLGHPSNCRMESQDAGARAMGPKEPGP